MDLKSRWIKFAEPFGSDVGIYVWNKYIFPMYSESHRKYHNLTHIESCLTLYDKFVPENLKDRHVIELAIWFHDIVYDTTAQNNEERSADLVRAELKSVYYPREYLQYLVHGATDMILATKTHVLPEKSSEALEYFLDIDMQILGSDEETYNIYEHAIGEEYSWVPDDMFRARRKQILAGFLDFPWIYHTKKFRQLFEGQARKNIKRAIAALV